jgi:hypothetical protein
VVADTVAAAGANIEAIDTRALPGREDGMMV